MSSVISSEITFLGEPDALEDAVRDGVVTCVRAKGCTLDSAVAVVH